MTCSKEKTQHHTHTTHTHTHKNANSLAAAKRSRAPGKARMPVHQAGTRAGASKPLEPGLGTRRSLTMPLSHWVWAPEVPPGPLAD